MKYQPFWLEGKRGKSCLQAICHCRESLFILGGVSWLKARPHRARSSSRSRWPNATRWFCTWLILLLWPPDVPCHERKCDPVLFCRMRKKNANADAFLVWPGLYSHWRRKAQCRNPRWSQTVLKADFVQFSGLFVFVVQTENASGVLFNLTDVSKWADSKYPRTTVRKEKEHGICAGSFAPAIPTRVPEDKEKHPPNFSSVGQCATSWFEKHQEAPKFDVGPPLNSKRSK